MNEDQTSIWETWANTSPVWQHQNLRARSLPEKNSSSVYAVDLASTMTRYINFELLEIKMNSANGKESWNRLSPVIAFVIALRELAIASNKDCVVSSANAQYLKVQVEGLVPGLGEMIIRDTSVDVSQDSEFYRKIVRTIEHIVGDAGGKFGRKAKEPLMRFAAVTSEAQGGFAGVAALWQFMSTSDVSEIMKPLIEGN